jgi:hypothetical protein
MDVDVARGGARDEMALGFGEDECGDGGAVRALGHARVVEAEWLTRVKSVLCRF